MQTHAPNSKEAQLAKAAEITYHQAFRMVYQRKQAFFNATPFSAWIAGQGTSFLCRQGVLCVLHGDVLQISATHATHGTFEICLHDVLGYPDGRITEKLRFDLLEFVDDIIMISCQDVIHCQPSVRSILAIDTRRDIQDVGRLIRKIRLDSHRRLFVRHTSSFICWGTRSGEGSSVGEWVIRVTPMDPQAREVAEYTLSDFHGKDIGSTIAFEIHGDYLYALSTQTTHEVEEIDWTSFYTCIRFPLQMKSPLGSVMERKRIWRRQHSEGPIIDLWTTLSIQTDECADKLFIVEGRREWQNGGSGHARKFYMTMIDPCDFAADSYEDHPLPANDPLVDLLSFADRPHYAPERTRTPWQVHSEPQHGLNRTFPLSHTKFGAYNLANNLFLDLVEDSQCCANSPTSCLRLRMGSRRPAPLDSNSCLELNTGSPQIDGGSSSALPSDDQRPYRYGPINFWPPPASCCPCSQHLHKLMSPYDGTYLSTSITNGALDEYNFVYMIRPRKTYGAELEEPGTIVVLSFCPDIPTNSRSEGAGEVADGMDHSTFRVWRRGRPELCRRGEC